LNDESSESVTEEDDVTEATKTAMRLTERRTELIPETM